ncbi:MAG: hypothetical protein R2694_13030 [Ilumatobacteraceae bacterium]|nr:hypothetical protein [Ilumatobacter sp.]
MDALELVHHTSGLIGAAGAAFYFAPATIARGQELGLDRVQFYGLGRGGVLGDVEPAVVSSAFGYFNPAMIANLWNAAREKCSPRVAGAAYMECCAEHGRARFADVPDLESFVAAGEKVLAACEVEAFPLFAGTAAEPAAPDAAGRAMQILTILREYRGCAHLVALRAMGIPSKDAHFVKRPGDIRMFGWADDDAPTIDDDLRARMDDAEALTDRMVVPAFAVLSDAEREVFATGVRALADVLAA